MQHHGKVEEENIMRSLGTTITTRGQHKINIAMSDPAAAWIDEGGALNFGDSKLAQVLLDAHKLHVAIKVTEELLYDNAFKLESSPFYADGIVYFRSTANNGYSGDLEIALIPEWFRTEILKEELDRNGVLVEKANVSETEKFALLFEFDGDINAIRHVLYNCSASRPSIESETKEDTIEPGTETLSLTADPREDGLVKSRTGDTTSADTYANWYKNVYVPQAKGEAPKPTGH